MKLSPKLPYKGLTIVLSKKSRFDNLSLLSANGGANFKDNCLRPELNIMQCEVRLATDKSPLLSKTLCILLLGDFAFKSWIDQGGKGNSLNEIRGSVFKFNGIPTIASYEPQDAIDMKDYERQFNDNNTEDSGVDDVLSDNDSADPEDEKSRKGKTRRSNYSFWLRADTKKAIRIIQNNGIVPAPLFIPQYSIYPPIDEVIVDLRSHKDEFIYIDIETEWTPEKHILCVSYSFGINQPIYVVPFKNHEYKRAYSRLPEFLAALARCFVHNIIVAHNGAQFDFIVFGLRYRIPVYRCYDTMLAFHRMFPEVEHSLGHATSYFTYEPFHKDESDFSFNTPDSVNRLMAYCGKDVYTMILIKDTIDKQCKSIPGLAASIEQVNESIVPYLTMTLMGIKYDEDLRVKMIKENDRLMMHYLKWLDILIGKENLEVIRGKGKSVLPTSNPQCCEYFHNILGYPIVAYGKPSIKDGSRKPSLAKKAFYKLQIKHENPCMDIIMAYRNKAHDTSTFLTFTPWSTPQLTPTIEI